MFWKTSENSSVTFWGYDDILLRLYIDIARNGDFKKLIRAGVASDIKCIEVWEKLVKKQEKETGSNKYNTFLQALKDYSRLLLDHTMIRACLVRCMLEPIDWEPVEILRSKGYQINLTTSAAFKTSIELGLRKAENLITKAEMKRKELHRMFEQKETEGSSFESIIAHLNFALGFTVNDDLTLSRYNEYQKILRAKQKAEEQANGRDKQGRRN